MDQIAFSLQSVPKKKLSSGSARAEHPSSVVRLCKKTKKSSTKNTELYTQQVQALSDTDSNLWLQHSI